MTEVEIRTVYPIARDRLFEAFDILEKAVFDPKDLECEALLEYCEPWENIGVEVANGVRAICTIAEMAKLPLADTAPLTDLIDAGHANNPEGIRKARRCLLALDCRLPHSSVKTAPANAGMSKADAGRVLGINRKNVPDKIEAGFPIVTPDGKIDPASIAVHKNQMELKRGREGVSPKNVAASKTRINAINPNNATRHQHPHKTRDRVCRKCGPVLTGTDLLCPECFETTDNPPK